MVFLCIFSCVQLPSYSDIWNLGGFLKQCEDKRQKSAENLEKVWKIKENEFWTCKQWLWVYIW